MSTQRAESSNRKGERHAPSGAVGARSLVSGLSTGVESESAPEVWNGSSRSLARRSLLFAILAGAGVSPAAAQTVAYVVNSGSDTVAVVNVAAGTIDATVPTELFPVSVAIDPVRQQGWVANAGSGTLTVFSLTSNEVQATVQLGGVPTRVAVSPKGDVLLASNEATFAISVVDLALRTVVGTIPVVGSRGLAFSPNGKFVYVTHAGGWVSMASVAARSLVQSAWLGDIPMDIAVSRDGMRVYVTNEGANVVHILDAASLALLGNISVGSAPRGIALSPDNRSAYVTHENEPTLSVLALDSGGPDQHDCTSGAIARCQPLS